MRENKGNIESKFQFVIPEFKKTLDVKQMLHIENVDFTGFYECKNSQKQRFILDTATESRVIIMTTADSNDGIRLSDSLLKN